MDLRKIKALIELVSESGIAELEITEAEGKVRLVKQGAALTAQQMVAMSAPVPALAAAPTPPPAAAPASTPEPAAPAGHVVKAPMVGTFYASNTPGGKPFVAVGQAIKKGDTLCIIEAMKIMSEIEAEEEGVITQILAGNGDAVEFGQPLFVIA